MILESFPAALAMIAWSIKLTQIFSPAPRCLNMAICENTQGDRLQAAR